MERHDNYRIHQGSIVENPQYRKQELVEYSGNPFIEALPPISTDEQTAMKFTCYPPCSEEERAMDTNIRYHMTKRLLDFVQPLDWHFSIERQLSSMIRRGYISRNPVSSEFLKRIDYLYSVKSLESLPLEGINEIGETLRSTAEGYSIIGLSGVGKSTAVERIILMYPQTIVHHEYKGHPLTRTQLVWLKLDCPHDGSIKTLCQSFFHGLDASLGTTYLKKYGNPRYTSSSMMLDMSTLAARHGLGILIIDEIQHLINKRTDPDEMLKFLVTLINTVGVPVVFVGTPKADEVLQKNFRQARRSLGVEWDRMEEDESWKFFLETMWEYQWLSEYTPLSPELEKTMYEESQGITSVAVYLYMFTQIRAMSKEREEITPGLIREVLKKDLAKIRKMIEALKNNDLSVLALYDDIAIDIESIYYSKAKDVRLIGKAQRLIEKQRQEKKYQADQLKEQALQMLMGMGVFKELKYNDFMTLIEEIIKDNKGLDESELKGLMLQKAISINDKKKEQKASTSRRKPKNGELIRLFHHSVKQKRRVYEVLQEEGYIADIKEYM